MPKVGNTHYPYTKAGMAAANKARGKKTEPVRRFFGSTTGNVGRPRTNKQRGYDK
jgi:hypothetical protein